MKQRFIYIDVVIQVFVTVILAPESHMNSWAKYSKGHPETSLKQAEIGILKAQHFLSLISLGDQVFRKLGIILAS